MTTTISGTLMLCASLTAYDGDTVRCDGQSLRPMGPGAPFVSGFDTPELRRHADCPAEAMMGLVAKDRMEELLATEGLRIVDSGEIDMFDRPLVWLLLPDGSTIGDHLLREGMAQPWPNAGNIWCAGS